MKYDFDQVVDRRNTNSYKWNVKENELPMWVADMDFPAAPEIRKAYDRKGLAAFFYRSPAIPFVHCAQIDDTGGECSRHDTGL